MQIYKFIFSYLSDFRNISYLVFVLLNATGCVMATYIGAMDLDYQVFWIKGASMSPAKEKIKVMESIFNTVGYQVIKAIIE